MSDDLISRKAVIDLIDKLGYINVSNHDDFRANCRMDKIRQEVSELPTSFDKEKIIGELKGQIELVTHKPMIAGRYIKKDRAIKIVEKVQLINVNSEIKKFCFTVPAKKGRTNPLVKISCFKRDI